MSTSTAFIELKNHLQQRIIGQESLVESLILSLLADGHLLVEGAPGLAKTTAIKALADSLQGDFNRVQFTPDLMPSDITGSEIYRAQEQRFEFQRGPIFANLVLADEINRAPAKVQSALLEAMSERQVSASGQRYELPDPFLVMATQNPVEHEGTYTLPEAQLDRFLMKVTLDYPSLENEHAILALAKQEQQQALELPVSVTLDDFKLAQAEIHHIHVSPAVEQYIVQLINATRSPAAYQPELDGLIEYGCSPRATIGLERTARALAWLQGDSFVTPLHVTQLASRVLAHRLVLSIHAQAQGRTNESVIEQIIKHVAVS